MLPILCWLSLVLSILAMPSWATIKGYRGMQADLAALTDMNESLRHQSDRMVQAIAAMQRSPAYRERVVRDELGYQRPGDITIVWRDRPP